MRAIRSVQWGSFSVSVDSLSFLDRVYIGAALTGILMLTFPHVTLAQTVNEAPLVFEINELSVLDEPRADYLSRVLAEDIPPIPPDPRIANLEEYLQSKKSPLAAKAEVLLEQYHFRLVIGISFAESNFCKHQIRPNNCWGIGGGYPESYPTLADGITRANNLIERYHDNGMTTPKLMRNTWVGWQNHNWVLAVDQVTQELEDRGL